MAVSLLRTAVRTILPTGVRIWLIKAGRAFRRLPGAAQSSFSRLLPVRGHVSHPLLTKLAREGRWDVLGDVAEASVVLGSHTEVNALARMAVAECGRARSGAEPRAVKGLVALCRPRSLNVLSPAILPHVAVALSLGRDAAATRAASGALARYARFANPDPFSSIPAFAKLTEAKQTALLLALAHHLQGLGHNDQAFIALGRALEILPTSRRIRLRLALAHLRAGRVGEVADVLFSDSNAAEHLTDAEARSIAQTPCEDASIVALTAELARRSAFQPAARLIAASIGRIEPYVHIDALGDAARRVELVGELGAGLVLWNHQGADTGPLARAFMGDAEIRLVDALRAQGDLHSPASVSAVAEYRAMPQANLYLVRGLLKWGAFRASEFLDGMRGKADPVSMADIDPERCFILSQNSIGAEFDKNVREKLGLRVLSLGQEPNVADPHAFYRVAEFFPVIASDRDIEAVREAADEARRISQIVMPAELDADGELARREIFELALEDTLVTGARIQSTLRYIVSIWNVDQVIVALTGQRYHQSLAIAQWMESDLGLAVRVMYGGSRDAMLGYQRVLREEDELAETAGAHRADLSSQQILEAIFDTEKSGAVFDDIESTIPHDGGQADVLLLASLTDPNYKVCAEEILSQLQEYGSVDAVSLSGKDLAVETEARVLSLEPLMLANNRMVRFGEQDVARVRERVLADIEAGCHTLAGISLPLIEIFLTVRLPQIVKGILLLQRFVRDSGHKAIVTTPGRHIVARGLTLWANQAGLQTIDVQAFFISAHPRYRRSLAQFYCGTIEEQISLYRDNMGPPAAQKILRIGSMPIAYKTRRVAGLFASEARARHGLPGDVKLVMFAAQHGASEADIEIIRRLADVIRDSSDSILLIKLHPRSRDVYIDEIRRLTDGLLPASRLRVVRTPDIYELIVASDLVVTQFSNVGLEAAVLDRQTLSVNLTGADYPIDLHEMGISEQALSAEELRIKVLSLLHDERAIAEAIASRASFFARNPEVKRGDGAKKVSALIFGEGAQADATGRPEAAGCAGVDGAAFEDDVPDRIEGDGGQDASASSSLRAGS